MMIVVVIVVVVANSSLPKMRNLFFNIETGRAIAPDDVPASPIHPKAVRTFPEIGRGGSRSVGLEIWKFSRDTRHFEVV